MAPLEDNEGVSDFSEEVLPVTCEHRLGGPDGLLASHRGGNMRRRHGIRDEEQSREIPDEPPPGWAEP
jgi:hypothetical protein